MALHITAEGRIRCEKHIGVTSYARPATPDDLLRRSEFMRALGIPVDNCEECAGVVELINVQCARIAKRAEAEAAAATEANERFASLNYRVDYRGGK